LKTYGIDAELTATPRTGWQRYTFPSTDRANILFNTGKANQKVYGSEVHVVGDRTVEGRVEAGNFCAGKDKHTVYFTATFDRPFASHGAWRGTTPAPGERDAAGEGGNGAWVTFGAGADRDVVVKVGLSYTGVEGARKNLTAETDDSYDFDATRAAAHATWERQLAAVKIGGGSAERQRAFYTALYHAQLHPNLAGDVDGRYAGFDGKTHLASGFTPYQNLSLWDTHRPQNQLLQMLQPKVARDVALSVVAIGRDGGWLPRWSLANSETNIMTGDPVTPFLVEAWSKGLLAGYEKEAYALLRKNALSTPPDDSPYNGRAGVAAYQERGYIPSGLEPGKDCPDKGGDNDCRHPASATMEYAAADASLALMAKGLGHTADARVFAARGQWYRNLWDSSIKQFRPRTADATAAMLQVGAGPTASFCASVEPTPAAMPEAAAKARPPPEVTERRPEAKRTSTARATTAASATRRTSPVPRVSTGAPPDAVTLSSAISPTRVKAIPRHWVPEVRRRVTSEPRGTATTRLSAPSGCTRVSGPYRRATTCSSAPAPLRATAPHQEPRASVPRRLAVPAAVRSWTTAAVA